MLSAYSFFNTGLCCWNDVLQADMSGLSPASKGVTDADEKDDGVICRDSGGVGHELSGRAELASLQVAVVRFSVFLVWFRWIFFERASIVRWRGLTDAVVAVSVESGGDGRSAASTHDEQDEDADDGEQK